MIHYASFRYDRDNYLAVGEDKNYLAVFVESSPRRYTRHGGARWPSWHKFMQGGELDNYEEGSVSHIDELEREYGTIARQHLEDIRGAADSRWTDNPFRSPDASPEQLEWYAKRDEALRIYRESRDDSMAIEIGLFPSREDEAIPAGDGQVEESREGEGDGMTLEKRIYGFNGDEFEVTRTSPDSIVVELLCDEHEHEEYIVGRIECQKGWGVGRREKGYPHDGDTFREAVERCAEMLSEECESLTAIDEVGEFFEIEAMPDLEDRLNALAAFLPVFEAPGFHFGRMILLPGDEFHYSLSEEASRFVKTCYDMGWVRSFDWAEWNETLEAVSLRDDPASLEEATDVQLEKLLTALIRQDRFVEGSLGKDFESGLLKRILKRASALSQLLSESEGESAAGFMNGPVFEYDLNDEDLHERFSLGEGYSIREAQGPVTCQPFGEKTYEVLAPITHPDGRKIRLTVDESVQYCPHPVKAEYLIHDQGDAMGSFGLFGTQLSGDLKKRVEDILTAHGVRADFEKGSSHIFVESASPLIGETVTRLSAACRAVSKLVSELPE